MENPSTTIQDYFIQEPGRPERIDLTFHIRTDTRESFDYLTKPDSPIEYKENRHDCYYFSAKNRVLDGVFTLAPFNPVLLKDPEHIKAADLLGFQPQSTLSYPSCFFNNDKLHALKEVMDYIAGNGEPGSGIEFYMIINDSDTGNPIFGTGYSAGKIITLSPGDIPDGLEKLVE